MRMVRMSKSTTSDATDADPTHAQIETLCTLLAGIYAESLIESLAGMATCDRDYVFGKLRERFCLDCGAASLPCACLKEE